MKLRISALFLALGLLVAGVSGCGSSDSKTTSSTTLAKTTGKPDTAAVATGIQMGFLVSKSKATCVAKKLQGKVSDEALRAVANAKRDDIPPGEVDAVLKKITNAGKTC